MKRKHYSVEYKQQAVYRFTEGKVSVSAIDSAHAPGTPQEKPASAGF